jgi:hypothetical protein
MQIGPSDLQPANADSWITESAEFASNVSVLSLAHESKAQTAISRSDAGMQIERSRAQLTQSRGGSAKRRDAVSNTMVSSRSLLLKQASPISVTDEGMKNCLSSLQYRNAFSPIVDIDGRPSQMTLSSPVQELKQKSEMHRSDAGSDNDLMWLQLANASFAKTEIRESASNVTCSTDRHSNARGPIISMEEGSTTVFESSAQWIKVSGDRIQTNGP